MQINTLRIKSSVPAEQGPFIIINEDDFDPETQTLWTEEEAAAGMQENAPADETPPTDEAATLDLVGEAVVKAPKAKK